MKTYVSDMALAIKFEEAHKVGFYSTTKNGEIKVIPASGSVYRYASRTVDNSTPEEFTVNGTPFDANHGVIIGKNRYAFRQADRGLLIVQLPDNLPKGERVDIAKLENGEVITAFLYWDTCSLGVKSSHVSLYGAE